MLDTPIILSVNDRSMGQESSKNTSELKSSINQSDVSTNVLALPLK